MPWSPGGGPPALPPGPRREIVMRRILRRKFIQTLAAGAALGLTRGTRAQGRPAATKPVATKLSDKVTLIAGAGNNIVALAGNGGTLLVDCGDAAHAPDLVEMTGPIKTVINTHWHLESTGAND